MIGTYITLSDAEYEIFYGPWGEGKKKETRLLCKRTKASGVPDAVLNEPFPIEEDYIRKMIAMKHWKKA